MSDTPPAPPTELPNAVVEAVADCSADELDALARYAEQLADHRSQEEESRDDERNDRDGDHGRAESATDRPEGVPAKASTTIKEINGNRYYYWQWRDGDRVRSQYRGPVDDAE